MDLTTLFTFANVLVLMRFAMGMDRDLSCAVCRALVDEVNYSISQVDPKKTIQVGSYRVDPNGNQNIYEKPYARSEIHLLETFEHICVNFHNYAEAKNSAGKKSISRTNSRNGETLGLKHIQMSEDSQKLLKFKCEALVEEYEEEMISLFRKGNVPDIEKVICGEIAAQCSEKDLQIPMPAVEYANVDDATDAAENSKDGNDGSESEDHAQWIKDNINKDKNQADTSDDNGKEEL